MSRKPISLSPVLKKLRDEGFDLDIQSGLLLVRDVPYVNAQKEVKRGVLVMKLILAGDVAQKPDDHVAYFIGEHPCRADGTEIEQIKNASQKQELGAGVVIDHTFSAKPKPADNYDDYHHKVTTYVVIISGPAQTLASVSAKTFPAIVPDEDDDDVFNYVDTATSRAEIGAVTKKLRLNKVAIVGLGGTGSYVLDLVAKTPVREIHLFEGDDFLQHNAFRCPGAPSLDELRAKPKKAAYFKAIYDKMRRGIVDHEAPVTETNAGELQVMDFAFVCMDDGPSKRLVVEKLEEGGVPFIDVGMGINVTDDALGGILRTTTSTQAQREYFRKRVSFAEADGNNEYDKNIQIADLNAFNAAAAVIKWKKLFGFYRDTKLEHHSTYTIDGNLMLSEDRTV